jgi:uncharacterized protein YgbK (DUF1537 family)
MVGAGAEVEEEVVDGETEEDVARVAARILQAAERWVACGTGALAGHLAAGMERERAAEWPRIERAVVVNGSLHERSREQARAARERWGSEGRWVIVESGGEREEGWSPARLAEEAGREIEKRKPEALVIFGGETALAVVEALGRPRLEPVGEILPGMPLTRCGELWLVTKAGGFGPVDVLERVRRMLRG